MKHGLVLPCLIAFLQAAVAQSAWTVLTPPGDFSISHLQTMVFTSASNGFVMGGNRLLLRTRDGGRTWASLDAQEGGYLSTLVFLSDTIGYASGTGSLLKTVDGGETWKAVGDFDFIAALHFLDKDTGIAARLHGGIFRTTDGGRTWEGEDHNLKATDMAFPDDRNGVVVGGGQDGNLYRTRDGGRTWEGEWIFDQTHFFSAVDFPTSRIGFLAGGNGVIARSLVGGETWTRMNTGTRKALQDIRFRDALQGYAVGEGGTVLRTGDGGETWSLVPIETTEWLQAVSLPDDQTVYVLGRKDLYLARTAVTGFRPGLGSGIGSGKARLSFRKVPGHGMIIPWRTGKAAQGADVRGRAIGSVAPRIPD